MSADATLSGAAVTPRRRSRLLRKVAGYSAIRASTEGLLGLRGILLATLLGPAAFGSWALLRLGTRYAALAGFGVFRGLEVELLQPGDRAASGTARPDAAGAALGYILAVAGALAAAALLASALVAEADHRVILQGFAAAVITEAAYGYALVVTRVRTSLRRYALLEAGTAGLHLLLGLSLAWSYGLAGAFAALAISSALGAAAASLWVEMRPVFRSPALRPMIAAGFPVALTGLVGTLLHTADRWVVAVWGGQELLGYYAFAAALASAAAAFALAVRTVVFPEVYGEAHSSGPAPALRRHLERSLVPFAVLVPPVLGLIGMGVGPVVALAAPGYAPAIAPFRLFLLAGVAVGLVNLAAVGAVAAGQQRFLPAQAAAGLALNLGLSIAALVAGAGLEGVAAASLAGLLVFAGAVLQLNARLIGVGRPERLVVRGLGPLAWCAVAVVIAGHAAVELRSEAAGVGIYLGLILPLARRCRGEWRRVRGLR